MRVVPREEQEHRARAAGQHDRFGHAVEELPREADERRQRLVQNAADRGTEDQQDRRYGRYGDRDSGGTGDRLGRLDRAARPRPRLRTQEASGYVRLYGTEGHPLEAL